VKKAHTHRIETVPGIGPVRDWKYDNAECEFSCKAKDIGLDSYVQCLEECSHMCAFSVRYAHSYYCKNRARVYAAKQLGK
jgi:hypothetical protein